MHTIGPYRFSPTDAERTVASIPIIWQLLADGRDATVIEPLRPTFTGDLAADLPVAWAAMLAAGPALRSAGQLPGRTAGRVDALHRSGSGGVPKLPAAEVEVGFGGVVGDRQATRQHHGRPWQALCIWSTEVIEAFAADGHPLAPGAAGENITVSGLPWADVRPGVRLRIGGVLCEVTSFALPCKQNAQWFTDGEFTLMHHERGPVSRVYATVLEPGGIVTGDPAILEP
ncbi:MAG: MOSC domain-containing protein [Ilumatobacteraceae bacterium]